MDKSKSTLKKIILSFALMAVILCCGLMTVVLTSCKDNDNPNGQVTENPIKVTITDVVGGSVTADKTSYVFGDTVTLTISADEGYEFVSIKVGETDKTKSVKNDTLVLDNVTTDITVTASFNARTAATVSVSVKDNVGGTALLNKTSGYVGDSVILSITPDNGYEVISVLIGGVESIGKVVNNRVDIVLETAETNIEVEFRSMPIVASISYRDYFVNSSGVYGTAEIVDQKETYEIGDTLEVLVKPAANAFIKSFTVNGVDRKAELSQDNKFTVSIETLGSIVISAEFDLTPVSLKLNLSSEKYGETITVPAGNIGLIQNEQHREYTGLTISDDGKIDVSVIPGTYTLTVQGFVDKEIIVSEGTGLESNINLVYQTFKNTPVGKRTPFDISTVGDGYVTSPAAWSNVHFKDTFGDFILTLKANSNVDPNKDAGKMIAVNIGDKIYGFIWRVNEKRISVPKTASFQINDDLGWTGAVWEESDPAYNPSGDAMWNFNNQILLNDSERALWENSGIEVKLVRKGAHVYIFIEDRCVADYHNADADAQANIALTVINGHNLGEQGLRFDVAIDKNQSKIDALLDSKVTIASGIENGTLKLDKADGSYVLGEKVTVTVQPAAETDTAVYTLKKLTVDGEEVTVSGTTYQFTVTKKTHTVSAEFEEKTVATVKLNISASKLGETVNNLIVTLSAPGQEDRTLNIGENTLTKLPVGVEYTLKAEGYADKQITIADSGDQSVEIIYHPFLAADNTGHGRGTWNFDKLNEGIVKAESNWSSLYYKDDFDNFVFTVNLKKATEGDKFQYFAVKIDNLIYGIGVHHGGNMLRTPNKEDLQFGDDLKSWADAGAKWYNAKANSKNDGTLGWWNFPEAFNIANNATEKALYEGDGLPVTIARKGTSLTIFVNGKYLLSYDVGEGKANIAILNLANSANQDYILSMNVSDSAVNAVMDSKVTVANGIENGTVTLNKADGNYVLGETVTITVTPDEATETAVYTLKNLTVDGEEVSLTGTTYEFTVTKTSYVISAEFETKDVATVNIKLSATKYGENVTELAVTLSAAGQEDRVLHIGENTLEKLPVGVTYTLKANGYLDKQITITDNTAQVLELVYQSLGNKDIGGSNYGRGQWDVSTLGEGYVTAKASWNSLHYADEFDDFVFTSTLKASTNDVYHVYAVNIGNQIYGVSLHQKDAKLRRPNKAGWELATDLWGTGIEWFDSSANSNEPWNFPELLNINSNADLKALYEGNGLTLTIARKGTQLVFLVGDQYILGYTVGEGKARVALMHPHNNQNEKIYVNMVVTAQTVNEVMDSKVTVASEIENGTVKINKADGNYVLGETVIVTITPEAATETAVYTLKQLTVNGTPVEVTGTNYEFTVTQTNYTISAEFESKEVATVKINVSASKFGENISQLEVTLSATGQIDRTLVIGENTIEKLPVGVEYTLKADGYLDRKITISDNSEQNVALVYNMFADKNIWKVSENGVTVNQNNGNGTGNSLFFKDKFDSFALTLTASHYTDKGDSSGSRLHVSVKFADGKVAVIGVCGNQFQIGTAGWGNAYNSSDIVNSTGNIALGDLDSTYKASGLEFKVVLLNGKLSLIADGKLIKAWDCSTGEAEVALSAWGYANVEIPVAMVKSEASKVTVAGDIENGTVEIDKTDGNYLLGETVTVTITPKTATETAVYTLKEFTVNGQKVELSGTTYTFTVTETNYALNAVFEEKAAADVKFTVTGMKYGVKDTLSNVRLTAAGQDDIALELVNDVYTVTRLPLNVTYTLKADGYLDRQIVIDDAGDKTVELVYKALGNKDIGGSNYGRKEWDISTLGDGYVTAKTSWSSIHFVDEFNDFVFTTKLGGATDDLFQYFAVNIGNTIYGIGNHQKDAKIRIPTNRADWEVNTDFWGSDITWFNETSLGSGSEPYSFPVIFDASNNSNYANSNLTLTIARKGTSLAFFLDGQLIKSYTVGSGVARFAIMNPNGPSSQSHRFDVSMDVSEATVNATMVNADLSAAISFTKYGERVTVDTVTLKNDIGNAVQGVTITDGTIAASNLPVGIYTLEADGYITQKIYMPARKNSAINMVYQPFGNVASGRGDNKNFNTSTYGDGYISFTGNGWSNVSTKDTFSDFTLTTHVSKYITTADLQTGFGVRIGNNIYGFVWRYDYNNKGMAMPINDGWQKADDTKDWYDAGARWVTYDGRTPESKDPWAWPRPYTMSEQDIAAYDSEQGLECKIVRSGSTLTIYMGETAVKTYTDVSETEQAEIRILGAGSAIKVNVSITGTVSENA